MINSVIYDDTVTNFRQNYKVTAQLTITQW